MTTPSTPPPSFLSFVRAMAQLAVERVGPLLVPAGLMLADVGLAVRRGALAEIEQRTEELEQRAAELESLIEQRAAELAEPVTLAAEREQVTAYAHQPYEVCDCRPGEEYHCAAAAEHTDAVDRAYTELKKRIGRVPLDAELLDAGWKRGELGWRPPSTSRSVSASDAESEAPGPLFWEPNAVTLGLRCAFDGADVLTVPGDGEQPGTLICEKCERTAPETPELQASRLAAELALDTASLEQP